MAIYTLEDYQSVKTAYLNLLKGASVVQVSIEGTFIRYSEAQRSDLRNLMVEMERELGLRVSRAYAKQVSRFSD